MKAKNKLKDKNWRLSHLYKIKDKNSSLITFKPNKAQEHFNANKHTRNVILKSRQLGFTTLEVIDQLDDVLWTPNFDCLFLSYDKESALDIFDNKVSLAWENYPEELVHLYKLDTDRSNKLKFGFGNNKYSSISVKSRGRSGTFRRLHISELGKTAKERPRVAKEIVSGTIPSIPIDGRIDIESTAEGEFGYFHDIFWDAWLRGNPRSDIEFKAHFYNWTWDEDEMSKAIVIDKEMMDKEDYFTKYQEKHNLSDVEISYYYNKWVSLFKDFNLLRQEYPTTPEEAFISSGRKLFDSEAVLQHQKDYGRDPIEEKDGIVIFDNYIKGHLYGLGVDVSEGIGQDASAIVVWDFTYRPKVVARYKSDKISPDNLAYMIKMIGKRYGTCLAAVERNNHGHATLVKLKEIYPLDKIYKEERRDKETDETTLKLGWHTNLATKPKMLYDIATALNSNWVEIPDKSLLLEMRTYDQEDLNKIKALEEDIKHWDTLIAATIGFQLKSHIDIVGKGNTETYETFENLYEGL